MSHHKPLRQAQSGIMLLEALIAILIFSLGILALVGLQATAINQSTDARYRSEAALLANDIIGQMWATTDRDPRTRLANPATLQANFNTGGALYNAWLPRVNAALPGARSNPPTIVVDGQGIATITINWLAPYEAPNTPAHNYLVVAQIR